MRTIEDIVAIESRPYDELVTARNLYDLFLATAEHVGDRKALTVLRSPDPADVGVLAHPSRAAGGDHARGQPVPRARPVARTTASPPS